MVSIAVFIRYPGVEALAWVGEMGGVAPPLMARASAHAGRLGTGDSAVDPNSRTFDHSGDRWLDPHTGCLSWLCDGGLYGGFSDS